MFTTPHHRHHRYTDHAHAHGHAVAEDGLSGVPVLHAQLPGTVEGSLRHVVLSARHAAQVWADVEEMSRKRVLLALGEGHRHTVLGDIRYGAPFLRLPCAVGTFGNTGHCRSRLAEAEVEAEAACRGHQAYDAETGHQTSRLSLRCSRTLPSCQIAGSGGIPSARHGSRQ